MGKKYAIGVDYGTQSRRAVLVDLVNGAEIAVHAATDRRKKDRVL